MVDDVLINKAATIERCVTRAREEYVKNPATFSMDFTRQDAAILNIQRACEAALDMGQHIIRRENLGVPQSARDVFTLLAQGGWINIELADKLKGIWMSFWNTVRRCCWVTLLRQKSKHETRRRKGVLVSKSHEDYEME